jgi:hypothetical protein
MTPLLALLLLACSGSEDPDCVDHGDCRENQGCVQGQCRWVDCIDNTRCQLEEYCDAASLTCVAGCSSDDDCPSGDVCDSASNACVGAGCRNTVLDCDYGQICDQDVGYCVTDDRAHCEVCDGLGDATCPTDGICVVEIEQDYYCQDQNDCRPDQRCDELEDGRYCHADRCQYECDPEDVDSCPRGWLCQETMGYPGTYTCNAECYWLEEQGVVDSEG